MVGGRQINRDPLPEQIRKIRDEAISIFVSILPQQISELDVMFWRAGRITDVFIPVDKRGNSNRGFASVRVPNLTEAEKAVELAEGSSWPTSLSTAPTEVREGIRRGQGWAGMPIIILLFRQKCFIQEESQSR